MQQRKIFEWPCGTPIYLRDFFIETLSLKMQLCLKYRSAWATIGKSYANAWGAQIFIFV